MVGRGLFSRRFWEKWYPWRPLVYSQKQSPDGLKRATPPEHAAGRDVGETARLFEGGEGFLKQKQIQGCSGLRVRQVGPDRSHSQGLHPHDVLTPQGPASETITLGVRFQYASLRGTQIQSTALPRGSAQPHGTNTQTRAVPSLQMTRALGSISARGQPETQNQ